MACPHLPVQTDLGTARGIDLGGLLVLLQTVGTVALLALIVAVPAMVAGAWLATTGQSTWQWLAGLI